MRITPAAVVLVLAALGSFAAPASAQRVPFFTGAGTAVDPEISVVNSGEILDAQAVVSGDMKHVTITARASSSQLLALRDFTFVGSGVRDRQGLVGGAGRGGNGADGAGGANGAPARGRNRDKDAGGADGRGRRDRGAVDDDDDAAAASAKAGGEDGAAAGDADDAKSKSPARRAADVAPAPAKEPGVLDRPGMTLVGRFED